MLDSNRKRLPLKIYDCFTSHRYGGNVGGIVFDAGALDGSEMQAIAREINAPVTGFVISQEADALELRFFMPTAEIAMCGHVTIGLFDHLHRNGLTGPGGACPPLMKVGAGDVRVSTTPMSDGGVVVMMDLPPPVIEPVDIDRAAVAQALGIAEAAIDPDLPLEKGSTGLSHLFVPITDLAAMKSMTPDFTALTTLSKSLSVSTVLPFSMETDDPANTLHCRDFCPAVGVSEVPASGTTNSALAGYLVGNGLVGGSDGTTPLIVLAEQGGELGRPSLIRSEIERKNGEISLVRVGGSATLVIDGFVNAKARGRRATPMERQPDTRSDLALDVDPGLQTFKDLVAGSLVWDSHAGVFPDPEDDLSALQFWRGAGVNFISFNVGFDVVDWQTTLRTLLSYRRRVREMAGLVMQVDSADDILAARKEGKLAVSFDIEGTNALNGDAAMVSAYFELGIRQMLLAYNLGNAAAGGCHDEDTGLTAFGREVVAEMNRVGMIVDCSHAAHRATLDMMEASSAPVVFTHSNPVARCAHGRNILDDQIRLCAATGGVVGINGMGIFLGDNDNSDETFADHVCYVAELVGAQHVGVGLDYKPASGSSDALGAILKARPDYWPLSERYGTKNIKLVSPDQLPGICRTLSQRGWSRTDLCGFLGENFLRVARAVWP